MEVINLKYRLLIDKYVAGTASADEIALLDKWLAKDHKNRQSFRYHKEAAEAKQLLEGNDDWDKFVSRYKITKKSPDRKRLIITLGSIAAAISIVVGLSFQPYNSSFNKYTSLKAEHYVPVAKTTLQLANGKSFSLNERHATVLTDEKGVHFTTGDIHQLEEKSSVTGSSELNTIQVPFGRTAQLTLADGTQVWLNAGSQLIFPGHFEDENRREVMLLGEGYFDVAHDAEKPFKVLTDELTYTVLGTSFNIRSYQNSKNASAVLVEGSLQVERNSVLNKKQTILKPGQRCFYNASELTLDVEKVNASIYSSWKNGYLTLDKNNIRILAKQIEQFYNCDITVCKQLQSMPMQLSGKLLLDENVEPVCQALCDLTGVNYKLSENQIEFYIQE